MVPDESPVIPGAASTLQLQLSGCCHRGQTHAVSDEHDDTPEKFSLFNLRFLNRVLFLWQVFQTDFQKYKKKYGICIFSIQFVEIRPIRPSFIKISYTKTFLAIIFY